MAEPSAPIRPSDVRTFNHRTGTQGSYRTTKTVRLRRWLRSWPTVRAAYERQAKNRLYAELLWRKSQRNP